MTRSLRVDFNRYTDVASGTAGAISRAKVDADPAIAGSSSATCSIGRGELQRLLSVNAIMRTCNATGAMAMNIAKSITDSSMNDVAEGRVVPASRERGRTKTHLRPVRGGATDALRSRLLNEATIGESV